MKTIWKYPLSIVGDQTLLIPRGGSLLCVQPQQNGLVLWAQVDPQESEVPVYIRLIGTGHPITEYPGTYLGTAQTDNGRLVWHIFYESKK